MESNLIDPEVNKILQEVFLEFEPVFKSHSGGVEVVSANKETITLRLKGHCQGCALAPMTFGLGVERLVKSKMPSVKEVRYTE